MPRRRLSDTDKLVLKWCRQLVKQVDASHLALLRQPAETNQIKTHSGHQPKRKGGSPPLAYNLVEVLADLNIELKKERPNVERIYPLYHYLKRVLNY